MSLLIPSFRLNTAGEDLDCCTRLHSKRHKPQYFSLRSHTDTSPSSTTNRPPAATPAQDSAPLRSRQHLRSLTVDLLGSPKMYKAEQADC